MPTFELTGWNHYNQKSQWMLRAKNAQIWPPTTRSLAHGCAKSHWWYLNVSSIFIMLLHIYLSSSHLLELYNLKANQDVINEMIPVGLWVQNNPRLLNLMLTWCWCCSMPQRGLSVHIFLNLNIGRHMLCFCIVDYSIWYHNQDPMTEDNVIDRRPCKCQPWWLPPRNKALSYLKTYFLFWMKGYLPYGFTPIYTAINN